MILRTRLPFLCHMATTTCKPAAEPVLPLVRTVPENVQSRDTFCLHRLSRRSDSGATSWTCPRCSRCTSRYACITADRQSKHGISRVLIPRGPDGLELLQQPGAGTDRARVKEKVSSCDDAFRSFRAISHLAAIAILQLARGESSAIPIFARSDACFSTYPPYRRGRRGRQRPSSLPKSPPRALR